MARDKNKPHETIPKAVALRYRSEDDQAFKVTAVGRGVVADKILQLARENGIAIREDPDLVEVLSRLDLGQEIPAEVYVVVGEILGFIYRTNQSYGQQAGAAVRAER